MKEKKIKKIIKKDHKSKMKKNSQLRNLFQQHMCKNKIDDRKFRVNSEKFTEQQEASKDIELISFAIWCVII